MPRYEVNKDGADEALDPQGANPKVSFNSKDTNPERKKSRTKSIVILVVVAICIVVVLLLCAWFVFTIVDTTPEWQKDSFYIETIPGLRYHPEHQGTDTMIVFNHSNPSSYKEWVDLIDSQLKDYSDTSPKNRVTCDYDKSPKVGEVCALDTSKWFPCTPSNNYGYHKASPCVFIRFNKIFNWTPEFYDTPDNLPEGMPANLTETIRKEQQLFYKLGRTVWLSCSGVDPKDQENIGPIRYVPKMGFPGYFFPYNNTVNYLSPVVAVQFEKPVKGVVIDVECRVWAKNIDYDRDKGSGYVNFQLLVDN